MTFFGSKGVNHIGSEDFSAFLSTLFDEDAMFDIEDGMACTMTDANTATVARGACSLQGYFYHHEEVDNLQVASGSAGYNRIDLVVATYTLGTVNDQAVQDVYLRVIQGTATVGEPSDPAYADGSIDGGDVLVDFPLYRLTITGVSTPVVEQIMPTYSPLQAQIADNAGDIADNAAAIATLGESVSLVKENAIAEYVSNESLGLASRTIYHSDAIVEFYVMLQAKKAISASSNDIAVLRLTNSAYKPLSDTFAFGYSGTAIAALCIETTGDITVRVLSGTVPNQYGMSFKVLYRCK